MKYIRTFEKYTPTASVTDKMKNSNYPSKYTDSDYKYKIGQFVRLLNKSHNRTDIPDDDIYEIVLRHLDKYGTEHYRIKKTSGVEYYMNEFWQVEKNKKGDLMFEPLTGEEAERFEIKRTADKYNL